MPASQARRPALLPGHEPLLGLLELYASKADGLILAARNRRQKELHLNRAEAIRAARVSLVGGREGDFLRFAASRQALPVTRLVAWHLGAISQLEGLPSGTGLKLCSAFESALLAKKRAEDKLVRSGKLVRDKGIYSPLDYRIAKLAAVRVRLAAGKAL
jgi:hypothetical protein